MKLRRRSKNGKEVGSWFVVVKNRWTNLRTKNAVVARKRAAAFLRGEWPEGGEASAADVARAAEHVPEVADKNQPEKGEAGLPEIAHAPAQSSAAPEGVGPSPSGAEPESDVDPIAEAAAAAAESEGMTSEAAASNEAEQRRQWSERFKAQFSGEAGGPSLGRVISNGTMVGLGFLVDKAARRMKPPKYLAFDVEANRGTLDIMAMAWDEQLRRWGTDLAVVEPWHAIVLSNLVLAGAMIFSLQDSPPDGVSPESTSPVTPSSEKGN